MQPDLAVMQALQLFLCHFECKTDLRFLVKLIYCWVIDRFN